MIRWRPTQRRPLLLHRWVASRGYAAGPMAVFVAVRLVQIVVGLWLLVEIVRWGMS